ncbi:MAG: DUF4199 domain-containing protein [Cyclobacteriaceae bacterium]|nr:DUF4199 domain-containing protein [Cyclobacteriaceae bacterium]
MSDSLYQEQKPMLRNALRYGLAGAFISIFALFLMFFIDRNPLFYGRYFDIVLIPAFVVFSIRDFKVNQNNGTLHFWQGMSTGIIVYIIIAIATALFILLFTYIISPELFEAYIENRLELLAIKREHIIQSIDEESYNQTLKGLRNTQPWHLALDDILKKSIIGLFVTILFSIIFRK